MRVSTQRYLMALVIGALASQSAIAQAPDARITGRVTDPAGNPISGANVIVRELGVGAATTEGGTYSLVIAASRLTGRPMTLQARAIGHAPVMRSITISTGTSTHDFQLVRDPLRLDAVVVTGVAEATASNRLGFSIGRVDEAQLREVPAANPIQALAGKVAAARVTSGTGIPGGETSIRLRSATSITPGANNAPLIVVDGVITKAGLSDINPQDIESIEVLKGPASAGIYGSDAAAGVINVITKRGRNAPEGRTVITLRNEAGNSGMTRRLPLNRSTNCTIAAGATDFARNSDGTVDCDERPFYDAAYPAAAPFRDQQAAILGNGTFYTNYVSIGRRQGATNFQTSFENYRNTGIIDVPGIDLNGLSRRNVRVNVDHFIRDNLDFSAGGFFTSSTNQTLDQGAGSAFFSVLFMPPDVDLFAKNDNGEPFKVDAGTLGGTTSSDVNPLYELMTKKQNDNRSRVQGSFRAQYRPTSWLSVDGHYGYDRNSDTFQEYRPKNYLNLAGVPQGGELTQSGFTGVAQNASITGAVNRTFGSTNAIFRASYLFEDEIVQDHLATGSNFGAANVPTLSNLDGSTVRTLSSETRQRARNFFGQAVFDIADRFNIDGLVRRDGSSLFGSDARWSTFYRGTASYLVSNDLELPNVDELRFRLSRGTAGLRPPYQAQYETFLVSSGTIIPSVLGNKNLRPAFATETEGGFNASMFKRVSLEYTYSVKTTKDQVMPVPLSSTAGFTFQWQNAGTIEGRTHEAVLGLSLVENANTSWRVNVTGDRTRQKVTKLSAPSFRFGAGCGATFSNDTDCSAGAAQSSDVFIVKEGETLGAMYGTHWVRTCDELRQNPANAAMTAESCAAAYVANDEGLLVKRDSTGTPFERAIKFVDANGNNVVKIGDANPDFSMGISSNLNYRNFSLYGVLDMVKGGNIYNQPRQWLSRSEFRAAEVDQAGKDSANKHPSAYYSSINDANAFSDYYVEEGGYAKLREVALGYQLNESMLQRLRINRFAQSMRLSLIGRNLVTWTKYSGLDPEVSSVGAVAGTGAIKSTTDPTTGRTGGVGDPTLFRFDSFGYPNFRTFSLMFEIGM